MPDEKAQHIEQLQSQGHVVAMVGGMALTTPLLSRYPT